MTRIALAVAAIAGLTATAVLAQTPTPPSVSQSPAPAATTAPAAPVAATPAGKNVRKVCGKEIRVVCGQPPKGDKSARDTRRQCVEANKAKFSADCQAAIDARAAERQTRKDARKSGAVEKPKL